MARSRYVFPEAQMPAQSIYRRAIRSMLGCIFALALCGAASSQQIPCPLKTNFKITTGIDTLGAPSCVVQAGVTLSLASGGALANQAIGPAPGHNIVAGAIINDGTISNGGQFSNSGATVTNFGTIINNNNFDNTEGVLTNAGILDNFGTLSDRAGDGTVNNTGILTNAGVMTSGTVTNTNGASFNNTGTLTLINTNNIGTFTNTVGASTTNNGSLVNSGSMVNRGTFDNPGSLTNNGTITNYGGWNDQQAFPGNYNITNNGSFSNYGNLTSYGFGNGAGGTLINQTGATLKLTGFTENVGVLTNNGSLTIAGLMGDTGTLTNNGALTIQGSVVLGNLNNTVATNHGTLTLASGSNFLVLVNEQPGAIQYGVLTNSGTISNNGGTLNVQGTLNNLAGSSFVQTAGSTYVTGVVNSVPAVQIQGGTLGGGGTINGDVNNSGGVVEPGSVGMPALSINGNYTQGSNGALQIDLGGAMPYQYDHFDVSGLAALDGTVDFVAQNAFTPVAGDDFTFLFFGSLSGDFAHIDLTGWTCPTGDSCDVVYGADSASLDILGPNGGSTPTPEPSTLLLLGVALLVLSACSLVSAIRMRSCFMFASL
jgi:hypothetical protein